jgi:1-acyl-sn-glycerol-3-phosphate acyltransferase
MSGPHRWHPSVRGDLNPWWRFGVLLAVPIVRALFRVRVTGIHHVPLSGSAILAFNHISVLDGPCIAVETAWRRRRVTRFLVASEIFDGSFTGWILRRYRQIPVRRGQRDAVALDEAIATIARGALAGIAPEGAVNPDPGGLQRVRSGIARIALPARAPVIPVGIWGTHRRWPKGGRRWAPPLRPRLGIAFGAPIGADGDATDPGDVASLTDRVRTALERQLAEARTLAGDPA